LSHTHAHAGDSPAILIAGAGVVLSKPVRDEWLPAKSAGLLKR